MQAIYQPKGAAREYEGWACNLWNGCAHGCVYCYVPDVLRRDRSGFHATVAPRPGILDALERDCRRLEGRVKRVFLCFTCDPFPGKEMAMGITRQAIEILNRHGIGSAVLTKAWVHPDQFIPLGHHRQSRFGVSVTTAGPVQHEQWEPESACWGQRLHNLMVAKCRKIPTWASCEPVINPDMTLAMIKEAAPFVDYFAVGRMNHVGRLPDPYRVQVAGIDWPKFREDAEALLQSLGYRDVRAGKHPGSAGLLDAEPGAYLIKEDLRKS